MRRQNYTVTDSDQAYEPARKTSHSVLQPSGSRPGLTKQLRARILHEVACRCRPRAGLGSEVSSARGTVNECFIHIGKHLLSRDLDRNLRQWDL